MYIRRNSTRSTKSTWDPIPYQVTSVHFNQSTGTRHDKEKTRDQSDWKLLASRPAQLKTYQEALKFPPTTWGYSDDWDDDYGPCPITRSERRRRQEAPTPAHLPNNHHPTHKSTNPKPHPLDNLNWSPSQRKMKRRWKTSEASAYSTERKWPSVTRHRLRFALG